MKVGILGGSFDPIHNEHISLANEALRQLKLDKLIIMPAYMPPHKPWKTLTPSKDRINICKRAFANDYRVEVSSYEIDREGTSYTYLTCEHFKELYKEDKLYFIVGEDMLENFYSWRYPERILACATLAVCRRNSSLISLEDKKRRFFNTFGVNFEEINYNGLNVSSTLVRVRSMIGEDISSLVPKEVEEYILKNKLYHIPFVKEALALEKNKRAEHSKRVALLAGSLAGKYKINEYGAVTAAIFHDVAKNLEDSSPHLKGFVFDESVPEAVKHQFAGAYVAEHTFNIKNPDVLNAIRYHTSGRENMSDMEKLIFLSDMLEESRNFEGIEYLRELLNEDLNKCLCACLKRQVDYIKERGQDIYPLTLQALNYLEKGEN